MEASVRYDDREDARTGVLVFEELDMAAGALAREIHAATPEDDNLTPLDEDYQPPNHSPEAFDAVEDSPAELSLVVDNAEDSTDAFNLMTKSASQRPLLTAAEEVQLAKRIERGDEAAKRHLIEANLRLVISVAKKYLKNRVAMEDLVQEGTLGLVRAAELYDWRKGNKFSTYAYPWIQQAVQRGMARQKYTIPMPAHVHEYMITISRARKDLSDELGRPPSDDEIASRTGLSHSQIQAAQFANARQPVSLNQTVGEDQDDELINFVNPAQAGTEFIEPSPEEATVSKLYDEFKHQVLAQAFDDLSPRQREVIELRFRLGQDGAKPLMLHEIAKRWGVTQERVRQIETKAIKKLEAQPGLREAWLDEGGEPLLSQDDLRANMAKIAESSKLPKARPSSQKEFNITQRAIMSLAVEAGIHDKYQIAAELGLTANTVKEALSKIRKEFGQAKLRPAEKTIANLALAISNEVAIAQTQ